MIAARYGLSQTLRTSGHSAREGLAPPCVLPALSSYQTSADLPEASRGAARRLERAVHGFDQRVAHAAQPQAVVLHIRWRFMRGVP